MIPYVDKDGVDAGEDLSRVVRVGGWGGGWEERMSFFLLLLFLFLFTGAFLPSFGRGGGGREGFLVH